MRSHGADGLSAPLLPPSDHTTADTGGRFEARLPSNSNSCTSSQSGFGSSANQSQAAAGHADEASTRLLADSTASCAAATSAAVPSPSRHSGPSTSDCPEIARGASEPGAEWSWADAVGGDGTAARLAGPVQSTPFVRAGSHLSDCSAVLAREDEGGLRSHRGPVPQDADGYAAQRVLQQNRTSSEWESSGSSFDSHACSLPQNGRATLRMSGSSAGTSFPQFQGATARAGSGKRDSRILNSTSMPPQGPTVKASRFALAARGQSLHTPAAAAVGGGGDGDGSSVSAAAATWRRVLSVSSSKFLHEEQAAVEALQRSAGRTRAEHGDGGGSGDAGGARGLAALWQRVAWAAKWFAALLQRQVDDARANPKLVLLACKAGLAATMAAALCVLEDPFDELTSIGIWAVVTVDLVYEANIGLSLSKGVNRTLGTLLAGLLALGLSHLWALLHPNLHRTAVLVCIFVGCAVPMFYRFRPPFKDKWNYAVTIIIITFHMLILSNFREEEKAMMPVARFAMIILGFVIASIVNLSIYPNYAGDALHALACKNFDSAATLLSRCVEEYEKGTVLRHLPHIWSGKEDAVDDKIHVMYNDIVMSDMEVDKLLAAVAFEPPHGRFFSGYPWKMYDEVMDALRYVVYDIIALDSCLRAEIQAPLFLRNIIKAEARDIADNCAQVMRGLATCLREFRWTPSLLTGLRSAEEAAVKLQHSISKHFTPLISIQAAVPFPVGVSDSQADWSDALTQEDVTPANGCLGADLSSPTVPAEIGPSSKNTVASTPDSSDTSRNRTSVSDGMDAMNDSTLPPWLPEFFQRQHSLGREWDRTVEQIAALSLVRFASLLLEVVAKMHFVVESAEVLAQRARFVQEPATSSRSDESA